MNFVLVKVKYNVFVFKPQSIGRDLMIDGEEAYLSYLPLAHMYEQVMMVSTIS